MYPSDNINSLVQEYSLDKETVTEEPRPTAWVKPSDYVHEQNLVHVPE